MLRLTFKRLALLALLVLLAVVTTGCFLRIAIGHGFLNTSGNPSVRVEANTTLANCDQTISSFTTIVACGYFFQGSLLIARDSIALLNFIGFTEIQLQSLLILLIIDPVVVQVPEDASNFIATYDDGTGGGPQSAVVTEVSSFNADSATVVTPEAGQKFVILEFPPAVPPTIIGPADPFDFSLQFEIPQLAPVDVKAMYTGKVELEGQTFYFPMLPCVTDFASIPAIQIPVSNDPADLMVQIDSLLSATGNPGCDSQAYNYNALAQTGPAIDIDKSPNTQTIASGSEAAFDITVTNTGDIELLEVQVSDPAAPLCDNLVGSLAEGAQVSYSCSLANVTQDFTNVATVTATEPEGVPGGITDQDSATVTVLAPAEGRTPVGGTAKFLAAPSDPSGPRLGIIVGPVTGIIFALALAAWYARRRWGDRTS